MFDIKPVAKAIFEVFQAFGVVRKASPLMLEAFTKVTFDEYEIRRKGVIALWITESKTVNETAGSEMFRATMKECGIAKPESAKPAAQAISAQRAADKAIADKAIAEVLMAYSAEQASPMKLVELAGIALSKGDAKAGRILTDKALSAQADAAKTDKVALGKRWEVVITSIKASKKAGNAPDSIERLLGIKAVTIAVSAGREIEASDIKEAEIKAKLSKLGKVK